MNIELELIEPDAVVSTGLSVVEQQQRGEIDIQIATAKRYPREITRFKRNAESLACMDEETAASMFYRLPRDGKNIEGPSVRLAEIVGATWGNLRYGARVIEVGDSFITAQGVCHDLETNNCATVEIRRRITNKHGKRFGDDMIQTTGNAACSIALRQAIFKVVPFVMVKDIYNKAKLTSIGKASSLVENRHKALDWFKKAGAVEKQVFDCLGVASIEDITVDHLITLRGLSTAIKDGETTIEEALAVHTNEPPKKAAASKNDPLKPATDADQRPRTATRQEAAKQRSPLDTIREEIAKCKGRDQLLQLADELKQDPSIDDIRADVERLIGDAITAAGAK